MKLHCQHKYIQWKLQWTHCIITLCFWCSVCHIVAAVVQAGITIPLKNTTESWQPYAPCKRCQSHKVVLLWKLHLFATPVVVLTLYTLCRWVRTTTRAFVNWNMTQYPLLTTCTMSTWAHYTLQQCCGNAGATANLCNLATEQLPKAGQVVT